ncbi:MAG: helix-turn-helix domain-containing protein, partial [Xanthobacteraceae bacterium]|nr:helix-turn-helix domain-containing protein [Xanthobacteraceae bacterium]
DALALHAAPVTLKELAAATRLHPSTAHRILSVMVQNRFVDRIEPGTYCLGAIVDPGQRVAESDDRNNIFCHRIEVLRASR